jgi:large subunit ribosomal protein L29
MFMAILHIKEIRKLKPEELEKKLADLKKELMRMRTQIAQGTPPEKPGRVKQIKRTIAKILTVKNERGVVKAHE